MHQVIKNYRDDAQLRRSFNELAKKTFYIDFEDWYQNGYWTDRYNPYSIIIEGKVIANVSVNKTDFEINGKVRHYLQLGTVMTDERFRNQGLIRRIMEEINHDFSNKIDGIYLFANNDVLSFYPKFGFQTSPQFEYYKIIQEPASQLFIPVPMNTKNDWDMLEARIKNSFHHSAFEMLDNSQLNMFYVSKYMQENVYYSEILDTYVIAEIEDDTLIINMVISDKEQDLNQIAAGFGSEIRQVVLGFTPKQTEGFEMRELNQDDCTLHISGNFAEFKSGKMMFPLLSHA